MSKEQLDVTLNKLYEDLVINGTSIIRIDPKDIQK